MSGCGGMVAATHGLPNQSHSSVQRRRAGKVSALVGCPPISNWARVARGANERECAVPFLCKRLRFAEPRALGFTGRP